MAAKGALCPSVRPRLWRTRFALLVRLARFAKFGLVLKVIRCGSGGCGLRSWTYEVGRRIRLAGLLLRSFGRLGCVSRPSGFRDLLCGFRSTATRRVSEFATLVSGRDCYAFGRVMTELERGLRVFANLPFESLDKMSLKKHVDDIGRSKTS